MQAPTLNENWSISVKILLPILGMLGGVTIWLTTQLWDIKAVQNISWTVHDQREWARQVAAMNATNSVHVPNPDDIFWRNHNRSQRYIIGDMQPGLAASTK